MRSTLIENKLEQRNKIKKNGACMKMKKITNPNGMKLLRLLHLLGTMLLCAGLLGSSAASLQTEPDLQLIEFLGAGFTRSGGILLLATGLAYQLFTRYGGKRLWVILKWVATFLLIGVSVAARPAALTLCLQLALLTGLLALSVYKWQAKHL